VTQTVSPASSSPTGRCWIHRFAAAVGIVTVAGWWGDWHWLLDLTSHFRVHWLIVSLAGAFLCLRPLRPAPLIVLLAAAAANAWVVAPYWLPTAASPTPSTAMPVRVVALNVRRVNRDTARSIAHLRERAADVVAVIEIDARWAAVLSDLDDLYPHRMIEPRDDNLGIALLSRWPLADARRAEFGGSQRPNMLARVLHPAGSFLFVATHPYPPLNAATTAAIAAQLGGIGDLVAAEAGPCIVAGDLNATPWSAGFRRLVSRGGLRDTALGRGVVATWNARLPLPGIPIDHVLVTPDVVVLDHRVGPDVGSDHLPVEAVLRLPQSTRR